MLYKDVIYLYIYPIYVNIFKYKCKHWCTHSIQCVIIEIKSLCILGFWRLWNYMVLQPEVTTKWWPDQALFQLLESVLFCRENLMGFSEDMYSWMQKRDAKLQETIKQRIKQLCKNRMMTTELFWLDAYEDQQKESWTFSADHMEVFVFSLFLGWPVLN